MRDFYCTECGAEQHVEDGENCTFENGEVFEPTHDGGYEQLVCDCSCTTFEASNEEYCSYHADQMAKDD